MIHADDCPGEFLAWQFSGNPGVDSYFCVNCGAGVGVHYPLPPAKSLTSMLLRMP